MLNYALITGTKDAVFRIYDNFKSSIESKATFLGGNLINRIAQNRSWAFVGYQHVDNIVKNRFFSSQKGVFVVNGIALSNKWEDIAQEALNALIANDPDYIFGEIFGGYNCASYTLKHGLLAFSDFSGTCPIYYTESNDFCAVSNRQLLLSSLNDEKLDYGSLSWLASHSNIFGTAMPHKGIMCIKPGQYLVSKKNITKIKTFSKTIWPNITSKKNTYGRENLKDNEWDEIVNELIINFKLSSAAIEDDLKLSLTGGKDSRLSLVLAISANLNKNITTFTTGPIGSPEIECAANLAKKLGIKHQPRYTSIANAASAKYNPGHIWELLQQHLFRYEASICPWDGLAEVQRGVSTNITGFGGELYRGPGGHAKQFKDLSFLAAPSLEKYWHNYHQKMDQQNVLRKNYVDMQKEWLSDWVHCEEMVYRKDILPEKFYVENRLTHWNGPLAQNVVGKVTLMPLLSPKVAKKIFELSPTARTCEIFHFEVMRRLSIPAVKEPFLNATWHKSIIEKSPLALARSVWGGSLQASAKIQSWQRWFFNSQHFEIINFFKNSKKITDIDSIIDIDKLILLINQNKLQQNIDIKLVLSTILICLAMMKQYSCAQDELA